MLKMQSEREIDKFVSETSHLASNNNHYYHQQMFEGVVSSCSYNTTNGFCLSDVGSSSSSMPSFDQARLPTHKTHFVDQLFVGPNLQDCYYRRGDNSGVLVDELGLAREFQKMEVCGDNIHRDPDAYRVPDCNVGQNFGVLEGYADRVSGNGGGFSSNVYRDERSFRMGIFGDSLGLNYRYALDDHRNCFINFPLEGMTPHQADECFGNGVPLLRGNKYYDRVSMYESNAFVENVSILRANEGFGNGGVISRGDVGYGNEIPCHMESLQPFMMDGHKEMLSSWASSQMYNHSLNEVLSEQYGQQLPGNLSGLSCMGTSQVIYPKHSSSRENVLYNSMKGKVRDVEEREATTPFTLMKGTRCFDPYRGEQTLLIQDKGLNGSPLGGRMKNLISSNSVQNIGERNFELSVPLQTEKGCDNGSRAISDPLMLQTLYNSLAEVKGNIYLIAMDQHGCRFLQKKFDEGSFEDVQLIFNEIIDHVVELMMNPFGNYLIQKLLDVCNEEQRMKIVHMVTKDRDELVRISLNTHGTRVVQKLIESLKTRKQISLIIRALEPGFLDLIQDLNGNHVVQRCLQCLSDDDNKFIFDAAAKYCVEIATHRHGCCVLQRCIAHSTAEHRQKLMEQICGHGLALAQDPFGNYVVQYIIELKIPSASAQLVSQFQGNYVHLATQKFSSHVVEKCLKYIEDSQPQIVYELLSVSHFEQLVQDPFANYVLQSALEVTKGALYESLVTAVRPLSILRTNPYCKKIFSRGLLKK